MLYSRTMEIWFMFAMVSLIFSGLLVFIQKVGTKRKHNSNTLNGFSSGISGVIIFSIAGLIEGYSEISLLMFGLAVAGAIVYLFSSNLRMDSFHYIDTTIALPLHKFVSPLFALLLGIVFFSEHLTTFELLGVALGVFVPLFLINKIENNKQENLKLGVTFIIFSSLLAGIVAAINKLGTDLFSAVLLFAGISNILMAVCSTILHKNNKSKSNVGELVPFDNNFLKLAFVSGVIQAISFSTLMLSFAYGGPLAIVYTITSLYILIPIVLSIIFYNEHWNTRKVIAIILSILAVILMG